MLTGLIGGGMEAALASEYLIGQVMAIGPALLGFEAPASRAARPALDLQERVETGAAAVEALAPVWRRLADETRDLTAFQSHEFAVAAARRHEARGDRVLVVVVEREGAVECLLPVAIVRRGGVRVGIFLGDPVAQYGDALMAWGASPLALDLALKRLEAERAIDVLELRRVRSDAAIGPALAAAGMEAVNPVDAPFADLAGAVSVDALLLAAGGAKQRRERARSRRRLEEKGEVGLEVRQGAESIVFLREAVALKRSWLEERGLASPVLDDPSAIEVLEQAAADPTGAVVGVAMRLTVGGEPAAYEVGLVSGGRFHAYLGAVADDFVAFSPGKTLMEEALQWCLRNEIKIYDLLPSADAYKRQWSTGAVTVHDVVAPLTALGRFYAGPWLSTIRPWLRAKAKLAPPLARRLAARLILRAGLR